MTITTKVTDIRDCIDSKNVIYEYNYLSLINKYANVIRTKLTIQEIIDELLHLQDVEISQRIGNEYYYPHDESIIFADIINLARQGQLVKVFHLDMEIRQHYYLVIEVLDQKLIWKIAGTSWSGRHVC
ncbi:hypothetical protein [Sporohalobacter salinus]|uniref:hypothetical protein n=1 Tax=Sporohalobacter salinus TaxID=1494606 RepID=UPI001960C0C2|nr:hypothetical protein [Sporohalobacter salinus]MBM7624757.1 uncharacterized protein (UPF0216 family) [Sporohalobacter salinus]